MAKIMLIEDNEIVCHALAVFLREEGHDVTEFTDSSLSIALMGEVAPDLIITDIIMPEVDGIELITFVKQSRLPIPVIAISGGGRIAGEEYLDLAAAVGAEATLAKPFGESALLESVREVLLN